MAFIQCLALAAVGHGLQCSRESELAAVFEISGIGAFTLPDGSEQEHECHLVVASGASVRRSELVLRERLSWPVGSVVLFLIEVYSGRARVVSPNSRGTHLRVIGRVDGV